MFADEAQVLRELLVAQGEELREERHVLLHEEIDVLETRDRFRLFRLLLELLHTLPELDEARHHRGI